MMIETNHWDWSVGFALGVMATVWSVLLGVAMADIQAAVAGICRWLWKRCLALWRRIASLRAGGSLMNPVTGRLTVATVQHLERVLGGDPVTETMVIRFIWHHWGAPSLCELPPKVAAEALRRPADFIRAAKQHCEPDLPF